MLKIPPSFLQPHCTLATWSDLTELQTLFASAFGHDQGETLWRWKYAGLDVLGSLLRWGDRVVAFYGGVPRPVLLNGRQTLAVQVCDVMTAPDCRNTLSRNNPFYLVASHFATNFVGPGRPYAMSFGFPSGRHVRLGERLGIYQAVDAVLAVHWPASDHRSAPTLQPLAWQSADTVEHLNLLWQHMQKGLAHCLLPIRDAARWLDRYAARPQGQYEAFWLVNRGDQPTSALVIRRYGETIELLDWLGAPDQALPVARGLAAWAAHQGLRQIHCWASRQVLARWIGLPGLRWQSNVVVPTFCYPAPPAGDLRPAAQRGLWWLMGGDTDFR